MKTMIKISMLLLMASLQTLSLNATDYSYGYDEAGNRIQLNSPLICSEILCECPVDKNDWLILTSSVGGAACPTSCEITHSLDIPAEYDCFTHYILEKQIGNNPPIFSEVYSYNGQIIPGIDRCLPNGESLTIKIHLLRYPSDPYPCIIEQTIECEYYCCDYINVNFIPTDPVGDECCWSTNISSEDGLLCDINDVTVSYKTIFGAPIPVINGVICISGNGAERYITYDIIVDGEVCDTRSVNLTCDQCDCPPDYLFRQWLTLTVDKDDPACQPEQCAVQVSLDIPTEYQSCYTHYTMSYRVVNYLGVQTDFVDYSSSSSPIPPSGTGFGFPNCIGSGQKIQVSLRLYANGTTTDYCQIISDEVFCESTVLIERPEACTPDNPLDVWIDGGKSKVTVNGCEYWVHYSYRKTSTGFQDVQMTEIEIIDPNCLDANTDQAIFQNALATVIGDILLKERKWKPQVGDVNNCVDIWRVIQNTCWSTWIVSNQVEGEESYVYLPCASECCVKQLRVCNDDGFITVSDLGFAPGSSTFDCSTDAILPPPPINTSTNGNVSGCNDKDCDLYDDILIGIDMLDETRNSTLKIAQYGNRDSEDNNSKEVKFMYRTHNTNEQLQLDIAKSELAIITVNIHNIIGMINKSQKFNLSGSKESLIIDISDLQSGTYICNVISNGIRLGTSKFLIVR